MAARLFILFILGVMLLIAGFIMQNIEAGLGPWSITGYSLGGLAFCYYIVRNRGELIELMSRRSARRGAVSVVLIVAFLGILVMAGLFSERHHYRWDLTKAKTHSIALQSIQQLQRLDRDTLELNLYAFYRGPSDLRSKQPLVDLLETYSYHSDRFRYEMVDIDRNPLLAIQLGISSTSTIILSYGERQEKIHSGQEAKITNAVAKLLHGGEGSMQRGAVYFVTGHGEPGTDTGEPYSFGKARQTVEEHIGPVREVLLATGRPVPDSCEILVVAGPEADFLPSELESIDAYLKAGGRALFLLEPFMAGNLSPFLSGYGVIVGDDLVIDLLRGAVGSPFAFMVDSYPTHDITRFFDVGTVFDMARSVSADSIGAAAPGVTVDEFIRTSEKSHAETNRELLRMQFNEVARKAAEEGRPVPIGAAATLSGEALGTLPGDATTEKTEAPATDSTGAGQRPGREARIVVIGDRDFITNAYLNQLGNSDLLLNCLRWLRGQSDEITIAPKETENTPIMLQRSELITMGLVTVLALPAAVVLIGIFVWIRRRSYR